MKNKPTTAWILVLLTVLACCSSASAATLEETLSQAMKSLGAARDDADLLMMTDAPYVRIDGRCALPYLERAQQITGCTVGKGNLLFFQRPQSHPLRLMLMKKGTGDAVIISKTENEWLSEKLNLGSSAIAAPSFWENAKKFEAGRDMFTLAAVANVWAKNGPYDFLKSAELHNHICPGLTSGYLIAHYVLDRYPVQPGERYTIVACPVWCKEDALQVVLDCTPGKKGMIVKRLSQAQRANIAVADPAGMLLIWDADKKSGRGVALSFDFDRLRALSPQDTPKAATVLAVLDHLDTPERFVSTAKEFDLNENLFNEIIRASGNPYEAAGLVKK